MLGWQPMDAPGAFHNIQVLVRATIKSAGCPNVRLSLIKRDLSEARVVVGLSTGVVTATLAVTSYSVEDRGGGWWRISLICDSGTGVNTPIMRIRLLDSASNTIYLGDTAKGIDVCELQARLPTGYDLFVPLDAAGVALGADGGSAWFFTYVPTEAGLLSKEARFTAMFNEEIKPGLKRIISGELEVRYA